MKTKQGYELRNLAGLAIVFVVLTIIISFGATILKDIQDDQDVDAADYNASAKGLESLNTFADWLPTLALIVVAAVILGLIVIYFAFGGAA